jgi:ribose transport system substrate-binding protein
VDKKRFVQIIVVITTILFVLSAAQSVLLIVADARHGDEYLSGVRPARYHFMVILPTLEGDFFQNMWEEIREAAEELDVGVELQVPRSTLDLRGGTAELLEIARLSQVDGIALYVTNEDDLMPLINRTDLSGIPVITLESDAPMSRRSSFIGSNSFKLGQEIGRLMQEAQPEGVRAALLKSEYYSDRASQWSIIKYGIIASLTSGEDDRIRAELKSQIGVLNAEEKARQILFLYPEVNVIFCTSLVDTISAANMVAEYRRAGEVRIIGYGYNQDIQQRMDEGYIYGTLVRDPEAIGRSGLQALVGIKTNKYVPSFIYIPGKVKLAANNETD